MTEHWDCFVLLFHTAFIDVTLRAACAWQMVIILTKGNDKYTWIGLFNFLCKSMLGLINHRIGVIVRFYNYLHGFRAGQSMGNASLKAKLLQELTMMWEEVLYKVFLNLKKASIMLDWETCLEILVGQGLLM